jgi:hypothetical protein
MCDGALTTTSENPLNILRDKTQWFTAARVLSKERTIFVLSKGDIVSASLLPKRFC